MPLDKEALKKRIEKISWLRDNWDGFDTVAVTRVAKDTSLLMVQYIEADVTIKVFPGVYPSGSIYFEVYRPGKRFEITVNADGIVEYIEINSGDGKFVKKGELLISPVTINEILT